MMTSFHIIRQSLPYRLISVSFSGIADYQLMEFTPTLLSGTAISKILNKFQYRQQHIIWKYEV